MLDVCRCLAQEKIYLDSDKLMILADNLAQTMKILEELPVDIEEITDFPDVKLELRQDETQPSCTREEILQNAPRQRDGYFVLPQTVVVKKVQDGTI